MRKGLLLIISVTALLVGCGELPYDTYLEAVEKTEAITSKGYEAKMSSTARVDTEGLSLADKRAVNFFKNVSLSLEGQYDKEKNQLKQVFHCNLNGIAFDMTYYQMGDKEVLKLPFIDKFIVLDQGAEGSKVTEDALSPSEATLVAIEDLWTATVEKDKVFKEEKDLVETPEGEIKATRYMIEFSGEAIKKFAVGVIQLIKEDEAFIASIEMEIDEQLKDGSVINVTFFLDETIALIEAASFEDIKYEAFVSIDHYIVKETFETSLFLDSETGGRLEMIAISFENTLFDINQEQEINMPQLTEENTTTMEDFGEGLPITIDGFN